MANYDLIYFALLPLLVAMLVVSVVHPTLVKIARRKHIVDTPNARKLNKVPVPMLGGVGVLCGILFAMGVVGCYGFQQSVSVMVVIALVVMLYTGVGDDILDFRPRWKFALQAFVVMLLIVPIGVSIDGLGGLWGLYYLPRWLSVILTLVAGVGIINAINLIDGVDGLCGMYVMMASLFFGLTFLVVGDMAYAVVAFATFGALIPFVLHNMYGTKYKMFLGDGGSLVLGFLSALFALRVVQIGEQMQNVGLYAFAFAVLSVPVCDTLRVMTTRMAHGTSPFKPDKRHLHHIFIALGMSHSATAFAMVMIGVIVVAAWAFVGMSGADGEVQIYATLVIALLLTWGVYYMLDYAIKRDMAWVTSMRCMLRRYSMRRTVMVKHLVRVLNDKT